MSDSLEFFDDDTRAGFRLHRAEVYNWGTFHGKVWTLWARGRNTLLTGDIGSGKSTLVDAITTLLLPWNRIVYNKAAGAETRERTLRTYMAGSYKAERGEEGGARSVGLRDAKSYSVILAHFRNEGFDADVTLAQVFWYKDPQQPPSRLHVVADRVLSIADDFSGFGSDIALLRKRLKEGGAEVSDVFKEYQDLFRRRFGIENPQALDLFHQTVSMKAVGNLTEFVREHMLEAFDDGGRVTQLLGHFEDLNRAHEAVLRAKDQVARLRPLIDDCNRLVEAQDEVEHGKAEREALRAWFAGLKAELLVKRLENLEGDTRRVGHRRLGLEEVRGRDLRERDDLMRAITENGGDRLLRLEAEIGTLRSESDRRRERSVQYSAQAKTLGLADAEDVESFSRNQDSLAPLKESLRDQEAAAQNQRSEAEAEFRDLRRAHAELAEEIESLRNRPSNLPREQIAVRARLVEALGIDTERLPFAGELMAVRDDFSEWEGAIERVLRSFALSLLVPDELYPAVSAWVDQHALGARLVYYRVRPAEGRSATQPDSLVDRLDLKGGPLREWLKSELCRRFDYVCCDDLDRFRRETRALTRAGQVKGGDRHEKDDRGALGDRTRYVLGWSNLAKLKALETNARKLEDQAGQAGARVAGLQAELSRIQEQLQQVAALAAFTSFGDLDWRTTTKRLAALEEEHQKLTDSNDVLETLRKRLAEVDRSLAEGQRGLGALQLEEGQIREKTTVAQAALDEARELAAEIDEAAFVRLAEGYAALGEHTLTVESCENRQSLYRQHIQARIDADEKRVQRLRDKIVEQMKDYQSAFPLESRELDASPEAADAYRQRLATLVDDDLPRYEGDFKRLLNENTIREVAHFQALLSRDRQSIVDRLDKINQSLTQIDYNRGRYICLLAEQTNDTEIREFVRELRACTEGTLTGSGDELYAEAKFLQVKKILERFRHRPGLEELDRRWTEKVTDVRQAFVFSASERWREDNREHEHYTDSAGKSGGQKEKLAYTVLAASLAYQFGLEWGEVRSRTFRFVAIDEAFGRGSDESTRYGLSLFARLNLQLLLVTPLQKIPVIEPFVASVGFVSNEDGKDSKLRNLTIEEYRTERQARRS